jgi:hypothetical protein
MKRNHILLAIAVLASGLLASPRGASSRVFDGINPELKDMLIKDGTNEPAPEPNPFDNLGTPITGKITSYAATPIGGYTCKDGSIQWAFGFGPVKLVEMSTNEGGTTGGGTAQPLRVIEEGGGFFSRGAPVKVKVAGKTILILGFEPARFNAVLSILHSAKLTNKDLTFQVAAVPGCADAFYAADVELK